MTLKIIFTQNLDYQELGARDGTHIQIIRPVCLCDGSNFILRVYENMCIRAANGWVLEWRIIPAYGALQTNDNICCPTTKI